MKNENHEAKEVKIESVSVDDAATSDIGTDDKNPEIEKLTAQLAELNDKYLRMAVSWKTHVVALRWTQNHAPAHVLCLWLKKFCLLWTPLTPH